MDELAAEAHERGPREDGKWRVLDTDDMERLVVGSGRSGSTLLSRMLSEDENTLSLSEFSGASTVGCA